MREHRCPTSPFPGRSDWRHQRTATITSKRRSTQSRARSCTLDGKAIDLRLTGVELADLRDAAWSLPEGGVGYYPGSNFIHVDTGRVRRW